MRTFIKAILIFVLPGCATVETSNHFGKISEAAHESYSKCVVGTAEELAPSGEPSKDIIEVAFRKCKDSEEAYARALVSDLEAKDIKLYHAQNLARRAVKTEKKNLEPTAKEAIIEAKATKAPASK